MDAREAAERRHVVEVARTYIGTPYFHRGQIKGVAADCATLLAMVYREAGLVGPVDLPRYSPQLHLHRAQEQYTDFIKQFAAEVERESPLPADIVVWKFHKAFAHGAIVTEWPKVIHAFIDRGVYEDDAIANQMLAVVSERTAEQGQPRPMRVFSIWGH